ncbi:MAG: type II toxin-antitoxin system VapC family toxin [Spirochaetes bacterium]|nr:type II toxin-antitoxin system VapC family toxin [Spirochaetota bacterium]MBU0954191.1 type II toxin-antitoxin system VapC family toxin [Spirochaetota bacterium]
MNELWLLDTHIWIRVLNGDAALNRPAFLASLAKHSAGNTLRLADISLWEAAMLTAKGRLKLDWPLVRWLEKAAGIPGLAVVPITPCIAADSATLPGSFHGDPADRLIVATARSINACLITLDAAILDYAAEGWLKAESPLAMLAESHKK